MSARPTAGRPLKKDFSQVTVIFLEGGTPIATFTDTDRCQAYLLALERKFPECRSVCRVERYPCNPKVLGA